MKFWRNHEVAEIPFSEMQQHISFDWTMNEPLDGLAACHDPDDLRDLMKHWYHGSYANMEVIVFEGMPITDMGDGWTVEPLAEISRLPLDEFMWGRDQ